MIDQIERLVNSGFTDTEISKELGISPGKVRWARRTKLKVHRYHGGQPGNKNSFVHGQGKNTIVRLTRKVIIDAGRDLYTCERCKRTSHLEFNRHHKDRDRTNNSPDNLEVLCLECHGKEHLTDKVRGANGRFK